MKTPNSQLADWLGRTGWSLGELARRVRAKAADWGHPHVSSDPSSIKRWIDGQSPRWPVPDILSDVFSAHFGYRVTAYDLGLGTSSVADRALVYNQSYTATVEAVADLGRADVDRRKFLTGSTFAVAAAVGPSRDWLLQTLDQTPTPGRRVLLEDVTAVKNMFGTFQQMDIFQGGGSGRLALAAYMNEHVFPLLRRSHTEEVGHALCEAAAEQTYLLGWMAYDNGEHGPAQRYLIQSLRLAEESGNAALGAHVLAGMADQATLLGHPDEGRRLAQAGRAGLSRTPESQACLADLWALEGRALAKLGEKRAAAQAVSASEEAYSNVQPDNEAEWARFIDPAYLNGEHSQTFQDLGDGAESARYARLSIEHARSQNRARRGAMSHAALAVSHLQRRDLEAAHAVGLRTLTLTRQVKSSRAVEAVQNLQKQMVPFGRHTLVADFNDRARELLAA
ncbi:transcriptional regulator [Kitasatospora sp. NPDC058478]|uniref:transcriptional regulator n=1 Tax=unclassified Kitasatospora TaxID=2633591 RepID=UPI00364F0F96